MKIIDIRYKSKAEKNYNEEWIVTFSPRIWSSPKHTSERISTPVDTISFTYRENQTGAWQVLHSDSQIEQLEHKIMFIKP